MPVKVERINTYLLLIAKGSTLGSTVSIDCIISSHLFKSRVYRVAAAENQPQPSLNAVTWCGLRWMNVQGHRFQCKSRPIEAITIRKSGIWYKSNSIHAISCRLAVHLIARIDFDFMAAEDHCVSVTVWLFRIRRVSVQSRLLRDVKLSSACQCLSYMCWVLTRYHLVTH